MRFSLIAILMASALGGCGTMSEKITQTTGVPLEQRCAMYQAGVERYEMRLAAGESLTKYDGDAVALLRVGLAQCQAAIALERAKLEMEKVAPPAAATSDTPIDVAPVTK